MAGQRHPNRQPRPAHPGQRRHVENSYCTLNAAGSSIRGSGANLTINAALTFKTVFAGAKNLYLLAGDSAGAITNWQARGTWTATSN